MVVRISRRSFLLSPLAPLAATRPLPPVSWTCPMHPEVVTDAAGACPICKMQLVAVRLESVWSCQLHPDLTKFEPGRCPTDGRTLVRMIKALSFRCPVHPKVSDVNPGRCPIDKRPLVAKYALRPHGDHNPKHGGQFFMAPNNWHVEVTYPSAGVFRLYVYDDYSRPFVPNGFSGRIIAMTDAKGKNAELGIPFKRASAAPLLEARVAGLALPATIAVKVRFQANEQEYRFDFPFVDYSKEPR
jgi:heavy metal-binding protein